MSGEGVDRPLPYNLDAERALLGAILLGQRPAVLCIRALDFFLPEHRVIFTRACEMAAEGIPIDLVTVLDVLERHGQVEAAGGAGYLAQLVDGVPRVSNVGHYAAIVREKAELRRLAVLGDTLRETALQAGATPEGVRAMLRTKLYGAEGVGQSHLKAICVGEVLRLELKPREMLLEPVLPAQGLAMLYSYRGIGKTFLALGMAAAVAGGARFLRWSAPSARRVLYVDGELPAVTLRDRIAMTLAGLEREPAEDGLLVITPDLQDGPMPDLATEKGQEFLEPHLDGVNLLILDNLSALCRSGVENEGESWLPVQAWALTLRRRGISVLFVHHAGKNLSQRGTSRREDLLDTVLTLKRPNDYRFSEGLRCEVHFEKTRGLLGDAAKPFEVKLESGPDGRAVWTCRDVEDADAQRAFALYDAGMPVRDVAEELGISKSKAGRFRKLWAAGQTREVSECPTL
jgi:putative DNA primase/helicase